MQVHSSVLCVDARGKRTPQFPEWLLVPPDTSSFKWQDTVHSPRTCAQGFLQAFNVVCGLYSGAVGVTFAVNFMCIRKQTGAEESPNRQSKYTDLLFGS